MPITDRPVEEPPRPATAATVHEFGRRLRELRTWSGLTQKDLEAGHRLLTDSTISDHERGVRLPRLEWLHAYVVTCLRHRWPDATRPQLEAELTGWRQAWTRLEHTETPTQPTIVHDTQAPNQTARAASTGGSDPVPEARKLASRRPRWQGRRAWLIGAAAVLITAGGVTAAVTGIFSKTPATSETPIHASGNVENLRGVEGIDLDTNNRADQEAPGVDISPSANSSHLYAMANKTVFTVLPEPGPQERQRCAQAYGWNRDLPNIYDLTEGRNICVKTDENRYSLLTITKRSSAATSTMNFHYVTWE